MKPILVMLSWRGGERLARCLDSIEVSQHHFKRIVLSITSTTDSDDMQRAVDFCARHPEVEVICTGRELPTMQHQAFWIDYLERTGAQPSDWIYWLAYDDEVRPSGIDAIVDQAGNWPLEPRTCYFGPWAMRHERPDALWSGDPQEPLESWTSFPLQGPMLLPVLDWVEAQILSPTYIQMSGSVCTLASHAYVARSRPRKSGPMRIELATAAAPGNEMVAEFAEPVSIIYGRSNSDRASYGATARTQDLHLLAHLARRAMSHPHSMPRIAALIGQLGATSVKWASVPGTRPGEEWRVRTQVLA